jgi:murein DD-endopeptidase MepM/ murein hydrolase activator NlpD
MFSPAKKNFVVLLLCVPLFMVILYPSAKSILANNSADIFSPPLGFSDNLHYGPRIAYDNSGLLIENTDYGNQNPDLSGYSTCFDKEMRLLLHAGEDWYRKDGQSTSGAIVTAIANGLVYNVNPGPYPGNAIVLEHSLPSGQYVYSVYMHIENVPPEISNGQSVVRGQRLGTVMYQAYNGLYPAYHPSGDDSHLHFEIRYFDSAASIYSDHPACNKGDVPGRGYTYPDYPPDTYPNSSQHYTDPTSFLQSRAGIFLPLIIKQESTCIAGQQLLVNGGFESASIGWVEIEQPGYPIITNNPPIPAFSGSWVAWFGGRNNADDRIYEEFFVTPGMTGANLSYYIWMGTDETTSGAYDKFFVRLRNTNDITILQLDYMDNNAAEHAWFFRTISLINLSSYVGQTLRLSFDGTTDGTLITNFLIDNVSLTAVCSGAQSSQPTGPNAISTTQPRTITGDAEATKPPAPSPTPTQPPYP